MINRKIQRINLSLYLNPLDSVADQRAVAILKNWHEEKKQSEYNRADTNMEIRAFHRNIYLAGLQLYLMSPQTCNYVAESIGRDAFAMADLIAELSGNQQEAPDTPPDSQDFTDAQVHQLKQMLTDSLRGEMKSLHMLMEKQVRQIEALCQPVHAPLKESQVRGNTVEEQEINNEDLAAEKLKKVRSKGIF